MPNKKIGFLIKQVFYLHEQHLNKQFSKFGLTASQTFTLIYLFKSHDKGISVNQKDIEKELDISNPTVTGILNRLEVKGLITRVPCRHDARAKNIEVTEKALELVKQLRIVFQQSDEKLVESLSKEEIDNLQSYLIKILRSNS